MKIGILTAALVAATALASGAAAQQASSQPSNYYRTNSTPAEMSATQSLNQKQAEMRGVTASGQAGTAVDANAEAVMKEYQEKLRANEEQQKLYQQQMEEYQRKYGEPKRAPAS